MKKPKIIYFANNRMGADLGQWLRTRANIVGLVLHARDRQRFGKEIIKATRVKSSSIFDGSRLKDPQVIQKLAGLNADLGVSVLFGYILRSDVIRLFSKGCVNLHPAYLPFNRGAYPNVWSIIDQTPAGAALHYINEGVDTGDIIDRREVEVSLADTGQSLYLKLEEACMTLFKKNWLRVAAGKANGKSQSGKKGTFHRTKDVEAIDKIDLNKKYTARDLINILRARTFPPYKGAYIQQGKKKIYLELKLTEK